MTARREAFEEIGLPKSNRNLPHPFHVEHLCELPTNLAKTELGVRPCVAYLHSSDQNDGPGADVEEGLIPRLNATEVAAIFSAPLHRFLSDQDTEDEKGATANWYEGQWNTWNDSKWRMHKFYVPRGNARDVPGEPHKVWGLTARILVDTARIAYAQEPSFEFNAEIGEEEMIRRLLEMGRLQGKGAPINLQTPEELAKAAKI
jgi:peroxisomal coenzyme A diphosphatase NUDT7